ncbi:MFS transporter [Flavisolibacter ginsenosidimutans]|uniref:MFS transporter n=2 Tax=Flavisolibacter ginsenosidimutans TaxID=661481 RepID=A0A5B8UNZ1_9BACT|nr:MFS transporter [Flavisolibacter ginsenosidimutans]
MLALVFVNVVINYMDRSNISVAGTALSKDFHLTSVQLGLVFSAFGWTYALLQIPGGWLADRFGPRPVYSCSLFGWSAATFFQGFVNGFSGLLFLRLLIGAFEAPAYPTNNRIATAWFPDNERASAIALYTSGQFVGLAFLTPLLVTAQHFFGWRGLFIATGLVGILWSFCWHLFYRDPAKHPAVNEAELTYIEEGGGLPQRRQKQSTEAPKKLTWATARQAFTSKKLWGIYIGQFTINSTLWFFLTWFPTYLVKYRGLQFLTSGFLASLPFIAAFCGLLLSGFASDYLLKKNVSAGIARKTPIVLGLLLSTTIVAADYVSGSFWIIFFLSLAFFGNGLASITWVLVSALAPKHLIGFTGGVFNFIGGLASVIVPIIIGYLASSGNFKPALFFIGVLAFVGACCYIFMVGEIKRIDGEDVATDFVLQNQPALNNEA